MSGKLDKFVSPFDQWKSIFNSLHSASFTHLKLIVLPEAALPYGAKQDIYFLEDVKASLEEVWGQNASSYLYRFE